MGTRGSFGVIVGEKEKIGYSQFDSYPAGNGVENLRWLRGVMEEGRLEEIKRQASACKLVSDDVKPKPKDIKHLAAVTDLSVSERSTKDWYCLTRATHGNIGAMLSCGYILDSSEFPLDSLFCEWAYIVDLDNEVFEVYRGFQKLLPIRGRWAERPSLEEDLERFKEHLLWCHRNGRDPYLKEESEYKAVELLASYPLSGLPSDAQFLRLDEEAEVDAA